MNDEIADPLDFDAIEVEITISDGIDTNQDYHHKFVTTETELEMAGTQGVVEMETRMALDAALRKFLSHRRGENDRPR